MCIRDRLTEVASKPRSRNNAAAVRQISARRDGRGAAASARTVAMARAYTAQRTLRQDTQGAQNAPWGPGQSVLCSGPTDRSVGRQAGGLAQVRRSKSEVMTSFFRLLTFGNAARLTKTESAIRKTGIAGAGRSFFGSKPPKSGDNDPARLVLTPSDPF